MTDALRHDLRQAYAHGATSWVSGPERLYRRLADALVATAPTDLAARRVLDLGSGTGVASAALLERRARPVGCDLSPEMLRQHHRWRPPGVAGDAAELPFATAGFDAVVAACCLNHLAPDRPLSECRRVLADDGLLLASSFPADRPHPVKEVLEPVLVEHGWEPPAWYAAFRSSIAPITGDGDTLVAAAEEAGFSRADTETIEVDTGLRRPEDLLSWRLSMPHTVGFVEALEPERRRALTDEALTAIERRHMPETIAMLVLAARV